MQLTDFDQTGIWKQTVLQLAFSLLSLSVTYVTSSCSYHCQISTLRLQPIAWIWRI